MDNSYEQIVKHILARYAPDESDREDEPQRLVSTNVALNALDVLYLYEAQQESNDSLRLCSLRALWRDLVHCQSISKKQTVLDIFSFVILVILINCSTKSANNLLFLLCR